MKNFLELIGLLFLIIPLFVLENGWGQEKNLSPQEGRYKEGEILVKFKEGVSPAQIEEINGRMGTEVRSVLSSIGVYVLKLPPGATVEAMVEKFCALPEVEYAEPNYKVSIRGPK